MRPANVQTSNSSHPTCPVLCITKICLFVVTTFFVLYLPLGDPQVICDARNVPNNRRGLICLCDVYYYLMRMADFTVESIDNLICAAMDALYEGKLKIYTALSTYDREDYCRMGSCTDCDLEDCDKQKRRVCKCKNTNCRRR